MLDVRKPVSFRLDEDAVLDHRNGQRGNMLPLHLALDVVIDLICAQSDCGDKNQGQRKEKMALAIHRPSRL